VVAGASPTALHRIARARGQSSGCRSGGALGLTRCDGGALRRAVAESGVKPAILVEPADGSVYVGSITYADAVLVALASEASADLDVNVALPAGLVTRIRLPAGRATLLLLDGKSGKVLGCDRD